MINYYCPNKNVNINEELNKIYMNINTSSAVKNFMQNTFYKNYENNFKKIIEIANSSKKNPACGGNGLRGRIGRPAGSRHLSCRGK